MRRDVESLTFILAVAAVGWLIVQFDKGQKESWRRAIANVVTPVAAYGCLTLMPFVVSEIHREAGSAFAAFVGAMLAGGVLVWGNIRLYFWMEKWADAKRPPDDEKKATGGRGRG